MSERIGLSEPCIGGNEWRYVKDCLDTGWVSYNGKYVSRFEEEFAACVGARHAVAVSSGTAGIHLALRTLECREGDEAIVPALTFVATANPVRYERGACVFADIDPATWTIDPAVAESTIGDRTRFMIAVDLLGHPADYERLVPLCQRRGLTLIEDATESLGASAHGRQCGRFGAIGCFSFNGNKIITTGGGGMIVTDDEQLARRARFLSTQAREGAEYYHPEVGYNYRMTNVQAALGIAQLERLEEFVAAKRAHAAQYHARLSTLPGITCPPEAAWARSSFWLYTIQVAPPFPLTKAELLQALHADGIDSRPVFTPLPMLPPYAESRTTPIPRARALFDTAVSLPSSVFLTPQQIDRVCDAIERQVGAARAAASEARG